MLIKGDSRNNLLIGTKDGDELRGYDGDDLLYGLGGNDTLYGGSDQDRLYGGTGSDVLKGWNGHDRLFGEAGDDFLYGEAGDDLLVGGAGADWLDGGSGGDSVIYTESSAGVRVDLGTTYGHGGDAEGDRLFDVEVVIGSNHADRLTGNHLANSLSGGDGADSLFGHGGQDYLNGGKGDDLLIGGTGGDTLLGGAGWDTVSYVSSAGKVQVDLGWGQGFYGDAAGDQLSGIEVVLGSAYDDTLLGQSGTDHLYGMNGDDFFGASAGADRLDGGQGVDTVSYLQSTAGVTASLAGTIGSGGFAQDDVLSGIEVVKGSKFADTLVGDGAANELHGNAGGDTLRGGGGADLLIGGAGGDILNGGAGADRFAYVDAVESAPVIGLRDVIQDFTQGEDRIDLSGIDAKLNVGGNNDFSFIGTREFSAEGQVRYVKDGGHTYLEVNNAGAQGAEMQIDLVGSISLQAGDFYL